MPDADTNGPGQASFIFKVHDDGGTDHGGHDIAASSNTISFDITPVNDAPLGVSVTQTIDEDTPYVFLIADFGFVDVDGRQALAGVLIATLPTHGALLLDGAEVSAGQLIDIDDIRNGLLVFIPDAEGNGEAYSRFTFQVQDNGGTANGGIDLDPTPREFMFDVTPLADAPGLTGTPTAFEDGAEDEPYTVTLAQLLAGYTDGDGDTLSVVDLATSNGAIAGNATDGWTITPTTGFNGLVTLTYTVSDGNGGTAAASASFTLAPVNDAPTAAVGSGVALSAVEGEALSFAGAFEIGDPDGADVEVSVTLTADAGTIGADAGSTGVTVDGDGTNRVVLTGTLAQVQAMLAGLNGAELGYRFDGDVPPANATLTLEIDDGGLTDEVSTTIAIAAVNDAPTGSDRTVRLAEEQSHVFTLADFGFDDAEDDVLAEVLITALPASGKLFYNGAALNSMQGIDPADIAAGKLVFVPAANATGSNAASFTFQLRDDGGTANHGDDTSADYRFQFDITGINDAPTGGVLLGGANLQNQTLIVDVRRLADADGLGTLHYQWQRSDGSGFIDIGADQATYVLGADDVGAAIRVVVSYTDGGGTHETVTTNSLGPIYASSRVSQTVYDTGDTRPWSSLTNTFDDTDSIGGQTFVLDNGGVWVNSYNTALDSELLWTSKRYDSENRMTQRMITYLDDTHSLTLYDVTNQYGWSVATITFDANWNQTGITGINDNGTTNVNQVSVASALDDIMWFTTPYDPNFTVAATNDVMTGGRLTDVLYGFDGNDVLDGRDGFDYIVGGRGNDILSGGADPDWFYFRIGDGHDVITDFAHGERSYDFIDLHGYGILSFEDLLTHMMQVGDDVVITFDAENSITLLHADLDQLRDDDFYFS